MRRLVGAFVLVLAAVGGGFWAASAPQTLSQADLPEHAPDMGNGERMFWAGGCASCHATPGQDDQTRLGGGLELETPYGTFRAPNVSPHAEGIAGWSTLDFVNAMVRGVSPDGLHYYPAFPYTSYQRMRVEDVIDLKAYMDTLEPVESAGEPGHDLMFPYSVRRGVGLWKRRYLDGQPFEPDPEADETVNRGAYLVHGPAHCGECHTPRDAAGGLLAGRWLAGGPAPEGEGSVPNITPHEDGIAHWSQGEIAYSLETGFTPEFDSFGGSMARVVRSTSRLPEDDLRAIAAYLRTVEPLPDG